ncbi:helix-turn-helix transcriptional regulator [Comamonas sp. CMM02]|nr:helix-turn-helix transcriptional regulator [Comamonas sp. CMM02]
MGFASPDRQGHALEPCQAQTASDLPVSGVVECYPAAHVVPPHSHPHGHLIYASTGVLLVKAATGQWLVPPTTAVWLRPCVEHELMAMTAVTAHGIFIAEHIAKELPQMDCVVNVSPLMREIISALVYGPLEPPLQLRDALLGQLLVQELKTVGHLPFYLPWPDDQQMSEVCEYLMRHPSHANNADSIAQRYAMTSKTLHRRFLKSTGMNFGQWRQKMRLIKSIEMLLQGRAIITVAAQSGYDSHSAYCVAFKKTFGCPPSEFIAAARNIKNNAQEMSP